MSGAREDFFPWSESYEVGISFADVQHKQLADIINRLYSVLAQGKGRLVVSKTVEDLIRYAKAHFDMEEKVLADCGYPERAAHHSEHERLVFHALEFYQDLMTNEIAMDIHSADYLRDWLGEEILEADRKFAPFLKGKGVP